MSNFQFVLLWVALPLGAALGSFAVALDSRWTPEANWRQILTRPSQCDACGQRVVWFDNIPILSWLLLGGRTRCCKTRIGYREILGELAGAALMVALSWTLREPATYLAWSMISLAVLALATAVASGLALALVDSRTKLLPNPLVATLFLSGAVFAGMDALLNTNLMSVLLPAVSSAGWVATFWLARLASRGGMGLGDIKLAGALGFWLGIFGLPVSAVGFFLAFAFGAAEGLILIAFRGASRKQQLPFGPAMLAGSATAIIFGNQIWLGYLQLVTSFAI